MGLLFLERIVFSDSGKKESSSSPRSSELSLGDNGKESYGFIALNGTVVFVE